MRTLWTLLILAFLSLPVQAQVTPPSAAPSSSESSGLPGPVRSLTIGRMDVDFQYADSTDQLLYAFDGPATAFRLSSTHSTLTFMYGQQAADTLSGYPTFNMIGVGLQIGGNNYIVREETGQPFALFIPVRMDASYTNVARDGNAPSAWEDLPHLHFIQGVLSTGVGGHVRLTQDVPLLKDRLVVAARLLKGVGSATNAAASTQRFGLSQLTELHLEVRLEHIADSNLGATLGYTRQSRNWSNDAPDSVYDVLSALLDGDGLGQSSSQGMLHVGINWEIGGS